ncbi:MAG: UDP-2,3-diacylglucosamine diphosphatase [Bacteroidota bacterium]
MKKRKLDIVVLSDIHLGTYGCHAKELLQYLKQIKPKILILNGDIIDAWQFKKNYFPVEHNEVIREILKKAVKGTEVYYLTGNHDDILRRFSEFSMGRLHLLDKLILDIDGKSYWFFHGDVFDASINISPWIAKIGGKSYDWLIWLNRIINHIRRSFGKDAMSFSKKIKASVKKAVKFVSDFEQTAVDHAIDQNFDYVICGHIHKPQFRTVNNAKGSVNYLNSGDWVESLTSLEYKDQSWCIYHYDPSHYAKNNEPEAVELAEATAGIHTAVHKFMSNEK